MTGFHTEQHAGKGENGAELVSNHDCIQTGAATDDRESIRPKQDAVKLGEMGAIV